MQIVSALFVENFEMRQAPGPSTRIDITGAMFSMAAPSPVPVTVRRTSSRSSPAPRRAGSGIFEVVFRKGRGDDDEQVARNVSPFTSTPASSRTGSCAASSSSPSTGSSSRTAASTRALAPGPVHAPPAGRLTPSRTRPPQRSDSAALRRAGYSQPVASPLPDQDQQAISIVTGLAM
jgi:hypothetical protein